MSGFDDLERDLFARVSTLAAERRTGAEQPDGGEVPGPGEAPATGPQQGRAKRRFLPRSTLALTGVVGLVAAGGVALAAGVASRYTPEQQVAQRTVAEQVERVLAQLPEVRRADLPASERTTYDQLDGMFALEPIGRALEGENGRYVFEKTDGDYCVISRGGTSCGPRLEMSPHFDFGYDPDENETTLGVVSLGDVEDLVATTVDGVEHRLPMGVMEKRFTLPGELRALRWTAGGEPFSLDGFAGMSGAR